MNRKKIALTAGCIIGITSVIVYVMRKKAEKATYVAENMKPLPTRNIGFYEKYIKRVIDIVCAAGALAVFSPLYVGIAILVKLKLGSPVLFTQKRPGLTKEGKETIFKMYKFRTMTDGRDKNGDLLPDEVRLTPFGKWLRSTSLDELPEAINILNGSMSIIGPRPQLVVDLVSMSDEQRMRHTAKPGLSGLAQINGRNNIDWEDKLNWDLKYIEKVGFLSDLKIVIETVGKAFVKREGITEGGMATAEDFGDYLLNQGKIDINTYNQRKTEAKKILNMRD